MGKKFDKRASAAFSAFAALMDICEKDMAKANQIEVPTPDTFYQWVRSDGSTLTIQFPQVGTCVVQMQVPADEIIARLSQETE